MKKIIPLLFSAYMLVLAIPSYGQRNVHASCCLTVAIDTVVHIPCHGGNGGSAVAVATDCQSNAFTYYWSNASSSYHSTNRKATALTAGSYTVTVIDGVACGTTASVTITQPAVLSVLASVGTNVSCYGGNNGSVSCTPANGTSPYTYTWSGGGTNATKSSLTAGTYTITLHDHCGASATASVIVTQPAQISVTASVTNNVSCYGGNNGAVSSTPSGGKTPYTYSWSGGGTNATKSGITAGTYTITVHDNCGASATASAMVTQPLALRDSIVAAYTQKVLCPTSTNGSLTAGVKYGTPPYTYLWTPSSETTQMASNLSAGTYSVQITDANGCTSTTTGTVGVTSNPIATVGKLSNATCFGELNGIVVLYPSGGLAPYSFLWSPYGTGDSSGTLAAGTYTVEVIDSLGCKSSTGVTITQPMQLTASATSVENFVNAIATGGTPPYTYSWNPNVSTNSIATGLSKGTYTFYVTDANKCEDSAMVAVNGITVTYSIDDTAINCGNPSTFEFDILAYADTTTLFNSCVIDLKYLGGEFAGDNFNNGGVVVTRGPNFQYIPGDNDYNILDTADIGDSLIIIHFGSPTDSSVHGYPLDGSAQVLLHVSLRIQGCETGSVEFTNLINIDSSYFTFTTQAFAGIDTTSVTYTLCCPYNCDPYPCDWQDSCSCYTETCYNTCYDTTWIYTTDTLFNTYSVTSRYSTTAFITGQISTGTCPIHIDNLPSISAGTNGKSVPPNSSILKITGSGFGRTKTGAAIFLEDANQGASLILDTTDVLSWSNSEIVVKMPDYMFGQDSLTPGTGPIQIYNECGAYAFNNLQINYNIEGTAIGSKKARLNIVMVNDTESILWRCDTSVSRNPQALACVKKAIRTWDCFTGVHWKLGDSVMLDSTRKDGTSVIYFGNYVASSTTLMTTQPWNLTCSSATDSMLFYDEADIKIRRNLPTGFAWSYDTTDNVISGNYYCFYNAILHEFGHAHGLAHINDSLSLMYRYLLPNHRDSIPSQGAYFPGPGTLYGAFDMINTSKGYNNSCSYIKLVPDTTKCIDHTLGVPDVSANAYNLNVYPNPASGGTLNIGYELSANSYVQFKIYDCIGREVLLLNDEHKPPGEYHEQVNVSTFAQGIYMFIANINGRFQTIKFIKL